MNCMGSCTLVGVSKNTQRPLLVRFPKDPWKGQWIVWDPVLSWAFPRIRNAPLLVGFPKDPWKGRGGVGILYLSLEWVLP